MTNVRTERLRLVDHKELKSELAGIFALPLKCDPKGALYLQTGSDPGVLKIDPVSGKRVATFPKGVIPGDKFRSDRPFGYFDVDASGGIHVLADVSGSVKRQFINFDSDGTYNSTIKLQVGFDWLTSQIASFPDGRLLITGERPVPGQPEAPRWPFTGVFASDGTLIKEVELEDDMQLHRMGELGDSRVARAGLPQINMAVTHGSVESGPDGNVYLMRAISPAILYAISPSGEVVRKFTVDPGETDVVPLMPLHISGERIAVLFHNDSIGKQLIKVVSLTGQELAIYDTATGMDSPGPTLACYSASDERFTFLRTSGDEGYLTLRFFEPR
jgi:hypothetical protein